jgi:hypothetical protein
LTTRVCLTLALGLLTLPGAALANPPEESTRIAVAGGWRYQPNTRFAEWTSIYGTPLQRASPGGPGGLLTFGYQVQPEIDVSLDVGLFTESFAFDGHSMSLTNVPLTLSVRWMPINARISPYLGAGIGYFLNFVSDSPVGSQESHGAGPMGILGALFEVTERWSLVAEYRLGLARVEIPGLGYLQTGGNTLVVGAQFSFAPERFGLH